MSVQKRIEPGYHFRLGELLNWRNLEALLTDYLSIQVIAQEVRSRDQPNRPFERSPIIAVHHPRTMLFRYLFHPRDIPRIYLSYPIGASRNNSKTVAEINSFRNTMHSHFTVFDPVTIDEKCLESLMGVGHSPQDTVALPSALRWDMSAEDTLSGESFGDIENLRVGEVTEITSRRTVGTQEVSSVIEYQIEERDFRLIEQSDYVIQYRPQYSEPTERRVFAWYR